MPDAKPAGPAGKTAVRHKRGPDAPALQGRRRRKHLLHPGPAFRTFIADHHHISGSDFPLHNCGHGQFLGIETASRALELHHGGGDSGLLDDSPFGSDVTGKDGEFVEEAGELSTPEIAAYLERIAVELHPGQQAEVNLNAPEWLASASRALTRGFILTIDYGYPAAELYASRRKLGTMLCYYRHQIEENPYLRLGLQDITTHVDFTTLMKCGEQLGLQNDWFGEQYRFLLSAGIVEEIEENERSALSNEEKLRLRLTIKKLILPDGGMGETFKVLIQSRGVTAPQLLCRRGIGG